MPNREPAKALDIMTTRTPATLGPPHGYSIASRFYAITAAGKKRLAAERTEWDRMVGIRQAVLSEPS